MGLGVSKKRMTRNKYHVDDDASSTGKKRIMTFENGRVPPWSDVNQDVLFLVMMQLGVVDFSSFSRVCKSWRSLALSNMKIYLASKPPMSICNFIRPKIKDDQCYLEDFERRKFKTINPHFSGRVCVGSTCGYFILFGLWSTYDFWLVNPITRHELHFPDYPLNVGGTKRMRGILVFSPSISGWVLVILHKRISFCIAGKEGWNHVSSTVPILDLNFCKGKIYTLHTDYSLGELRLNLNQKHKWTLLETKNCLSPTLIKVIRPRLVSSGENLYVTDPYSRPHKVLQLDFGEMKWVSPKKETFEYTLFISCKNSAAIKAESWLGTPTPYKSLDIVVSQRDRFHHEKLWYFLHDCLNVNHLDE